MVQEVLALDLVVDLALADQAVAMDRDQGTALDLGTVVQEALVLVQALDLALVDQVVAMGLDQGKVLVQVMAEAPA